MKQVTEKTVLIIGGSSGMGLAAAKLLISSGYQVIIASRNPEKLRAAMVEINSEAVKSAVVDIEDMASVKKLLSQVGQIDHLVLPGSEVVFGDYKTMPFEDIMSSFNSKLFGPMRVIRAAMPHLNQSGSVVLFSGSAGARPLLGTEVMSAINSAVEGFSRALALSLAPVRVNTISPGLIDTPVYHGMAESDKAAMLAKFTSQLPIDRAGQAEEVAKAVLYLIENTYSTGATIYVDGGHTLK